MHKKNILSNNYLKVSASEWELAMLKLQECPLQPFCEQAYARALSTVKSLRRS